MKYGETFTLGVEYVDPTTGRKERTKFDHTMDVPENSKDFEALGRDKAEWNVLASKMYVWIETNKAREAKRRELEGRGITATAIKKLAEAKGMTLEDVERLIAQYRS
jgi:hypothetical protein